MALDGGGGGPVGTSNSFTGTAETLELLGTHIYGYSGTAEVTNSAVDLLNFTTGNYYTVCTIQPYYDDLDQGDNVKFSIEVGGTQVYSIELAGATTANVHRGDPNPIPIIIPSYTSIKVTGVNSTDSDTRNVGIVLIGRIYR